MYCLVLQIPESVKINGSFVNNSVTVRWTVFLWTHINLFEWYFKRSWFKQGIQD